MSHAVEKTPSAASAPSREPLASDSQPPQSHHLFERHHCGDGLGSGHDKQTHLVMLSMFVASPDFCLTQNARKVECPLLQSLRHDNWLKIDSREIIASDDFCEPLRNVHGWPKLDQPDYIVATERRFQQHCFPDAFYT